MQGEVHYGVGSENGDLCVQLACHVGGDRGAVHAQFPGTDNVTDHGLDDLDHWETVIRISLGLESVNISLSC